MSVFQATCFVRIFFLEVYFRFECGVVIPTVDFCHLQAFSQRLCFITTPVDLPGLSVRCHRSKSKPMDRSELPGTSCRWCHIHSQTQRGRHCLPCSCFFKFPLLSWFTLFFFFILQDLGNTNFSIHLPQSSFDRRATGNVILRAVRSLGIDAQLNDRNDICIGPYKISDPSTFIFPRTNTYGNRHRPSHLLHSFTFVLLVSSALYSCLIANLRFRICVQNSEQAFLPPRNHVNLDETGRPGAAPTTPKGVQLFFFARSPFSLGNK